MGFGADHTPILPNVVASRDEVSRCIIFLGTESRLPRMQTSR